MKMRHIIYLFLVLGISISRGQTIVPGQAISFRLDINTTMDNIGFRFDLRLDSTIIPQGAYIDSIDNDKPLVEMRDIETDAVIVPSKVCEMPFKKRGIQIKVPMKEETEALLELLKTGTKRFYIHFDRPLKFHLRNSSWYILMPDTVDKVSASVKFALTESQSEEIVAAYGGYYEMYGTKTEAGWRIGEPDSTTLAGYFDFNFIGKLIPGTLSEIGASISTKFHDVTTQIKFTPFVFRLPDEWNNVFIKGAYELNQSSTEQRAFGSVFYQAIAPNLLDLTQGYHRLRLKPVTKFGVNVYYYTKSADSTITDQIIAEPFFDLYYYLPVGDKFSVLIEGNLFLHSDRDFNFMKKNASWHWDFTLGYDIAGQPLKVMAKYSTGVNSISFEKDDRFILGLLMNMFNER
jgi:hypothetical protein